LIPGLISSITTVRNGEAYLREAIDSLLAQDDPAFEVVVVDDGSTDATPDILRSYQDPRLTVRSVPPTGRAQALAEAVRTSRGELLAVLDADDAALPRRFALQRRYLEEHPEVALVGSAAVEFEGSREWRRPVPSGPPAVRRAMGMYNPFYHSSVMFRREAYEAVGGYRPDGGWGHDKDFLIRMTARYAVDILPEPLIRYRRHPQQMSTNPAGETFRRRKSAALQLAAARELKLAPHLWLFPLLSWGYAHLPGALRPRGLKEPVKRFLLRALRIARP